MECPYCNEKMFDGYIPTIRMALMWIPDDKKVPPTIFNKTNVGVNLTKVPFLKMQKAKSYYCSNCKVVITPLVEEN